MSETVTFGAQVRDARIASGRTLKDVAATLGLSIPFVSDIERGRRTPPIPSSARRWAAAVGLPGLADRFAVLAGCERGGMTVHVEHLTELVLTFNRCRLVECRPTEQP